MKRIKTCLSALTALALLTAALPMCPVFADTSNYTKASEVDYNDQTAVEALLKNNTTYITDVSDETALTAKLESIGFSGHVLQMSEETLTQEYEDGEGNDITVNHNVIAVKVGLYNTSAMQAAGVTIDYDPGKLAPVVVSQTTNSKKGTEAPEYTSQLTKNVSVTGSSLSSYMRFERLPTSMTGKPNTSSYCIFMPASDITDAQYFFQIASVYTMTTSDNNDFSDSLNKVSVKMRTADSLSSLTYTTGGETYTVLEGTTGKIYGSGESFTVSGGATITTNHEAYQMPPDELINMYTLYFEPSNGYSLSNLTYDDIHLGVDSNEDNIGSAISIWDTKTMNGQDIDGDTYQESYTALVGFPSQTTGSYVTFTVADSSAVSQEGTVSIYSDENYTKEIAKATTTNGAVTISCDDLTSGSYYYYKFVPTSNYYTTATGSFKAAASGVVQVPITLKNKDQVDYTVSVTVRNADTNALISGASVTVGTETNTTNESGVANFTLTNGTYNVTVTADGYSGLTAESPQQIIVSNGNVTTTLNLIEKYASVMLPDAYDADTTTLLTGATALVAKTSGSATNYWGISKTLTCGDTYDFPMGREYEVTVSKTGYTSAKYTMSISSDGAVTYTGVTDDAVYLKKISDPMYSVIVSKASGNTSTYTATVNLSNIAGNTGAFGIKYDKDLFTSPTFSLNSALAISEYTTEGLENTLTSSDTDSFGYHVFVWSADGTFDATSETKTVCTYTFTLNTGKSESDILSDSITLMPYDKTTQAQEYIKNNSDAYLYTSAFWRSISQSENYNTVNYLDDSQATYGGFYQVYNLSGSLTNIGYSDVLAKITYSGIDNLKSTIGFVVSDEDSLPLEGAAVKVFSSDGVLLDTVNTDSAGMATYVVDGDERAFRYSVSLNGYWSDPESGTNAAKLADLETTLTVSSILQKKIYHTPTLIYSDSTEVSSDTAALTGDKLAYNGRDYYFSVKPASSAKKFTYPSSLAVIVYDGAETARQATASFDSASNMYVLDSAEILGDATTETADEDGFASTLIKIVIDDSYFEDSTAAYTAWALAGNNGAVTHTSVTATTSQNLEKITVANIKPTESSGTFTFTPDAGYKVEKVYINGVRVHDYDDLETAFTYSFDNVDRDNSIAVTFYNGSTASKEALLTVAVGENGVVNNTEERITNTVKMYMYPGAKSTTSCSIEATTTGYTVNSVKLASDGETTTAATRSVSIAAGGYEILYATFRASSASDTYNVFVASYVDPDSMGKITPVGISILNKHDSPAYTLDASEYDDWTCSGVKVNGVLAASYSDKANTKTYTLESVMEDAEVVAVFGETSYPVTGKIGFTSGKSLSSSTFIGTPSVIFKRESDGTTVPATFSTASFSRSENTFTANLPKGTWTLTASLQGSLNYSITGIEINDQTTELYLGDTSGTSPRVIYPLIGDTTGRGTIITMNDPATVAGALTLGSAYTELYSRADVDADGSVGTDTDMAYVKANFAQRATTVTYADFCAGN